MKPSWEESEFIFCDLQTAARATFGLEIRKLPAIFSRQLTTRLNFWPRIPAWAVRVVTWVFPKSAPGELLDSDAT